MGSDGNPPRSPARLPHTDGPVTANIDGQFWHSQLTSPLPFLTMPSTVSQVWYTHPGFVLHESRPHLPAAPHGQREIHRGRLIRGTASFCYVLRCRTATHSSCRHPQLGNLLAQVYQFKYRQLVPGGITGFIDGQFPCWSVLYSTWFSICCA
jgi:hypothetical protein